MSEFGGHTEKLANWYDVLGVDADASESDIRDAYLKLAKQNHPDMNAGDAGAELRFKQISEAYAVLSNATERARYDEREVSSAIAVPRSVDENSSGIDWYRVGFFGSGAAIAGGVYLLAAFFLFDASLSADGDAKDGLFDPETKKVRLKYERILSERAQANSRQAQSDTASTPSRLNLDNTAPDEEMAVVEPQENDGGQSSNYESARPAEVDVAALPPVSEPQISEQAYTARAEDKPAADVKTGRIDDGRDASDERNSADENFDDSVGIAPELVPLPGRKPSRLQRDPAGADEWGQDERGGVGIARRSGGAPERYSDGGYRSPVDDGRAERPVEPRRRIARRFERMDDLPPLPDGAGFRRWIISKGRLCWIQWSGDLKCGSEIANLTEARRQRILARIRREVEGQPMPRGRFGRQMGPQRSRAWISDDGLTCWYGRNGYEVCERR